MGQERGFVTICFFLVPVTQYMRKHLYSPTPFYGQESEVDIQATFKKPDRDKCQKLELKLPGLSQDNFRTQTQNLPDRTSYTKTADCIWHFITITNMMIKHSSWAGTRAWQNSFNSSLLIKSKLCRIQSFMDFFSFDKINLSKSETPLNISGWHLHIKVILHFQTSLIFLPLLIHYKGWWRSSQCGTAPLCCVFWWAGEEVTMEIAKTLSKLVKYYHI